MRRIVLMTLALCTIAVMGDTPALAQDRGPGSELARELLAKGTGHRLMPPEEYQRLPLLPLTRAYIPEAVDLSDRFPPPGDQGKVGACVSWSTGYAVRSYYAHLENGTRPTEASSIASPAYIHNWMYWLRASVGNAPEPCAESGATFELAARFLRTFGALSLAEYGQSRFCPPAPEPGPQQTGRFQISDHERLSELKPEWRGRQLAPGAFAASPDRIKLALKDGHPVLYGTWTNLAFHLLGPEDVYRERLTEPAGGHAIVIVGYDDRRRAFRVLNSWGTKWADRGFGWIDYDAAVHNNNEIVVLRPAVRPTPAQPTRPVGAVSPVAAELGFACASLQKVRGEAGNPKYVGFVSRHADRLKLEATAAAEKASADVDLRPWPICEALLTLEEPLRRPGRPKVELVGGDRPLRVGDRFALQATSPDVPAFLYLVYVEDDGTVVNLAPRLGPMRRQLEPGTVLQFGDGQSGRPTFKVTRPKGLDESGRPRDKFDPERGHEAVIAIAARAPIDELEALEKPDSPVYARVDAKPASTGGVAAGPPDRLFLSALRDIVLRRAAPETLPREVTAAVLHLRITE